MGIYLKGKNWYIDYYVKGRRKRKKVGPSKKQWRGWITYEHQPMVREDIMFVTS